ncbi:hypothetical protein HYH02_008727 [Chlamydomonas schloesseri]|uniref:Centromere protein J C-terminal domain-containing protein n=1 Tax=Chlamydomonas schloesseri TaxID=2026947 RepID=A0A835WD40_9CHLO|nr:hypothetical protein HYH02_008727 [Chlamydomonas schloesseri]|eukprot:KAG2445259.1 hypothetical protein HYH02_008727 [Chlamydomonas schloesseri]
MEGVVGGPLRSSGALPVGGRFLRSSVRAAWATQQAEEDLELEEFRALETQIKADVVGGGSRRRQQHSQLQPQQQLQQPQGDQVQQGGSALGVPSSRSYAALHQQQHARPPVAPAPARHSSGSSGAVLLGRGAPGGGVQQPQPHHDRYGGLAGGAAAQHGNDLGAGDAGFNEVVEDEGEAAGELGWGAQHSAFIGVGSPGTAGGGLGRAEPSRAARMGGFGGDSSAVAGRAQQPSDGGASGPKAAAASGSGSGFDDADAWNDGSSFLGAAAGVGARGPGANNARASRGAAAAGSGGFGQQQQQQQPRNPQSQRLEDPWAAPPAGAAAGDEDAWDDVPGQLAPELGSGRQAGGKPGQAHQHDDQGGMDQPFVRALFKQQQQQRPQPGANARQAGAKAGAGGKGKGAEPAGPSQEDIERAKALEEQLASVAAERSALVRLRTELEKAANRLEQERNTWEKTRAEEQARWEAHREAEDGRLRRDRRVLEKQSKALLKLPNKKERSAMEAAEAALEAERREGRAREARHKLTVERLRRQLVELQERNHELREEVRWHEAQQLERGWSGGADGAGAGGTKSGKQGQAAKLAPGARPCRAAATQTEPLPFLPPLEDAAAATPPCGGGGGALDADGDYAGAEASLYGAQGGTSISGGAARRPGTAGAVSAPRAGSAGAPGARLRPVQQQQQPLPQQASQRAHKEPGPARAYSQQQQQPAWRVEREGGLLRKSAGGASATVSPSNLAYTNDDLPYHDDEDAELDNMVAGGYDDDGDEEELAYAADQAIAAEGYGFGEAGPVYGYGRPPGQSSHKRQQPPRAPPPQQQQRQPLQATTWWGQGGQGHTDYGHEGEEDCCDDDGVAIKAQQQLGPGAYSDRQQAVRRARGAAAAAAAGDNRGRNTAFDDQELVGDEAFDPQQPAEQKLEEEDEEDMAVEEGLGSEELAALAWRQHQDFMARMGLPPGSIATQPLYGAGAGQPGTGAAAAAGLKAAAAAAAAADGAGAGAGLERNARRPGAGPVGMPSAAQPGQSGPRQGPAHGQRGKTLDLDERAPGPSGRQSQQQQQQQQVAAGGGRAAAGAAQGTAGGGSSSRAGPATAGSRASSGAPLHAQQQQQRLAGANASAGVSAVAGPARPLVPGSLGQGSMQPAQQHQQQRQQQQQQQQTHVPAGGGTEGCLDGGGSMSELNGVSQTLAALRRQRQIEATAAAAAATAGGGAGARTGRSGWDDGAGGAAASYGGAWEQVAGARSGGSAGPAGQSLSWQEGGLGGRPEAGRAGAASAAAGGPGSRQMEYSAAGAAAVASAVANQQLHAGGGTSASTSTSRVPASGAGVDARSRAEASLGRFDAVGGVGGGGGGLGGGVLVREVRHGDGKLERVYSSGARLVLFANGTRKVALADGSTRVYFTNGDIKWTSPHLPPAASATLGRTPPGAASSSTSSPNNNNNGGGVVHYYYAEVGTWHSTYGGEGGVEVFYFPSGQVEAHHPGRGKEIAFPDGVLRVVTADGDEVDVAPEQLSWAIQQPQPDVSMLGDDVL